MTIVIEVHNGYSQIIGQLTKPCIDQLRFATSYAVPGSFFSKAYQNGYWDGRRHLFNIKGQTFPTGLLSYVKEILQQNQFLYSIKDCRKKPTPSLSLQFHNTTLRPYQEDTVKQSMYKQRGIIRIATAGGKTVTAAKLIADLSVPTLILIHKRDIFWQIIETLERTLQVPIGRIGIGEVKIEPITVAMIQTVARVFDKDTEDDEEDIPELDDPSMVTDFVSKVQCVIVDEGHHISQGQYEAVLKHCPEAFYRYALSATPFRSDKADLVIEAHTAKKIVDISASHLIELGYLAKPDFYMCQFKHSKQPTSLSYAQLYTQEIVTNTARNDLIIELAKKFLKARKTILIAVTRIEHGEILEALLKAIEPTTVFAHGEVNSEERRQILKELDARTRQIVIATTVFGEGVDVPNLDVLINAKAAESAVDALQLAGRALRITPTKKTATIVDIMDTGCRFFEKHAKSRHVTYKTERLYHTKEIVSANDIP